MRVGINYANDGAISGRVFAFKRKTRFLAATPKDEFADPCADGVERRAAEGEAWVRRRRQRPA